MKSNRIKKLLTLFSFAMLMNLTMVICAIALEVATHKAINNYIVDENSVVYGSYLNSYLKNNLGMQDGVKSNFNSKMAKEWIGDGGVNEDDRVRPRNHFYDPITNKGLSVGKSALEWATLSVGEQDFSWNDVRTYYRNALTAQDKTTRETNFAKTFRGLGQLMHLVQDMSIPAHTRNDDHLYIPLVPIVAKGDPYEKWAEKNVDQNTPFSTKYPAYAYAPYNKDSFLIPQLFDSGQYPDIENKLDPNITVSQKNIGLAEYTNANFLSNGTIFKNFVYPSYKPGVSMSENPTTINGKRVLYLKKIGEGETINHFARAGRFLEKLPAEYKELNLTIKDDNIHQDYANVLIPRAIGYSSQALKYFFRGQLDVTLGDGNIKIKNASDEKISGGKFRLYYDNAEDVRTPLTDPVDANTLEKGSGEQTITFNKPEGAKSYMLVYEGQLGAEPNAVIGKYIPADSTFAVFTIGATGKKSTVVVYDIAKKSILLNARENTDAEYVSWIAATKPDTRSSSMFNTEDLAYKDTKPYKFDPEFIDETIPGSLIYVSHADNAPTGLMYYEPWYYPQSRYCRVAGITPTYYAGFRTESRFTYTSAGTIYFSVWNDGTEEVINDSFDAGYASEFSDIELAVYSLYPNPPWHLGGISGIYTTIGTIYLSFYSVYGQIGETIAWNYHYADINHTTVLPESDRIAVDRQDRSCYHIRGVKNDDCFAMATVIVIQPTHYYWTSYMTADPFGDPMEAYEERHDILSRIVRVQAAGEDFNGKVFYEKSPNPTLEAELKKAIELFYTVNGFANDEFCKTMTFGIMMRK